MNTEIFPRRLTIRIHLSPSRLAQLVDIHYRCPEMLIHDLPGQAPKPHPGLIQGGSRTLALYAKKIPLDP